MLPQKLFQKICKTRVVGLCTLPLNFTFHIKERILMKPVPGAPKLSVVKSVSYAVRQSPDSRNHFHPMEIFDGEVPLTGHRILVFALSGSVAPATRTGGLATKPSEILAPWQTFPSVECDLFKKPWMGSIGNKLCSYARNGTRKAKDLIDSRYF
jgi:hypothetical protein